MRELFKVFSKIQYISRKNLGDFNIFWLSSLVIICLLSYETLGDPEVGPFQDSLFPYTHVLIIFISSFFSIPYPCIKTTSHLISGKITRKKHEKNQTLSLIEGFLLGFCGVIFCLFVCLFVVPRFKNLNAECCKQNFAQLCQFHPPSANWMKEYTSYLGLKIIKCSEIKAAGTLSWDKKF